MDAAAALREARTRSGLTQIDLGRRAGVPQSVVSAYERGRRDPSVTTLRRLVAAAGFDLALELTPQDSAFSGPVGALVQPLRRTARGLLLDRGYGHPGVFGSVARGTDRPDSDLDIVVDVPESIGLFQLNRMAIDLEDLLGVVVDLVPRSGLRPRVAASIAEDLVQL